MEQDALYRVFIGAMAAFLQHRELPPFSLSSEDWEALYALSYRQSLSGALYDRAAKAGLPPSVAERLRHDGYNTILKSTAQQEAQQQIAQAFSKRQLAHLFFKGAVIRQYYPEPLLRSMGDIDMLIHEADRDASHEAMLSLGFSCAGQNAEVWIYRRGLCVVEVHTALLLFDRKQQHTVAYTTVWQDAYQTEGTTFRLIDEAEARKVISHLAAHFCSGGCGLRQLMDVAALCNALPTDSFWERVLALLSADGTDTFARHLLWLCARWFDCPLLTAALPLSEEGEERLRAYLLSAGTFGADERLLFSQLRRERAAQETKPGTAGQLFRWLFPSASYLKKQYPYAEKHPVLLPVAFGNRLLDGLTKNRRLHQKRLRYTAAHLDELEEESAFFDMMGL